MVSPSAPAWIGIRAGTNAAAATTDARVRVRGDRVKLTSWPSSDAYEVSCRVRARVFARLPLLAAQCAATGRASPQGRLSASGEPVGPPLPPVGCVRLRRPALAGLGVRRPSDAVARPETRLADR